MPQRDARLQTIQAEIDRCMSEVVFLGSGVHSRTNPNREILNQVNAEVGRIQIEKEKEHLHRLLEFVKPMITTLISEIMKMQFEIDSDWGKLKNRLDVFSAVLWTLSFTQNANLGALFSAIRNGIVESKPKGVRWMDISDREACFRGILNNIGLQMQTQHSTFAQVLPDDVSHNITNIELILVKPVSPIGQGSYVSNSGWKADLKWVQDMIKKMQLKGSPLETILNLVEIEMIDLLQTIVQIDFKDKHATYNLHQKIREFHIISKFLSTHDDLRPLFNAIKQGIQDTIPAENDWRMDAQHTPMKLFISCLIRIGHNIVEANSAIQSRALGPIANEINLVGRRLNNIRLDD
jgi:hypothetical protein